MYDFLISEVWWMETIVAAAITGVLTLVGYFIVYNYNLKQTARDARKAVEQNEGLSKEHNGLSKEHSGILREQSHLAEKLTNVANATAYLSAEAMEAKGRREQSGKQELNVLKIQEQLMGYTEFVNHLKQENAELKQMVDVLHKENIELKAFVKTIDQDQDLEI